MKTNGKAAAKNHPRYTEADYRYLREKGYRDDEIIAIWQRDEVLGKPVVTSYPTFPNLVGYLNQ